VVGDHGSVLRIAALVLPLGLDTFAVAAAMSVAQLTASQRLRLSVLFAAFEGGMPLVGLIIGAGLGRLIGGLADYLAIAALAGLGAYMLRSEGEQDEPLMALFARAHGIGIVGLGLSVSLDELAIGFTIGLLRVPLVPAVLLIAAQAFIVSQVGFALGGRVAEAVREGAERLAGAVLIALAVLLLLSKLVGLPF
jgi:putative Mn2+ efflux pump MntP